MNDKVWIIVLCYIVLAIAPLWIMFRVRAIGSRQIARIALWGATIILGIASFALAFEYSFPGFLLFFLIVLYPIMRVLLEDVVRPDKQERPLAPAGQYSCFMTDWLKLRLDHDSGKCSGSVRRGKMQNWQLHEMDGHDLKQLRAEFMAQDPLATALLDLWLDREGPVHWRRDFDQTMLTTPTPIVSIASIDEAARILGVAYNSPAADVQAAQARLESLIGKGSEHSSVLDLIAASARMLRA